MKIFYCFLVVIFSATFSYAATYYVSTTGNDANIGTSTKPFKTIQKAINRGLNAGDTVRVLKGRHATFFFRNINGVSGLPITIKGDPGAIIDMNLGGANPSRNIDFYGGSYITINGLEITDSNPPAPKSCAGSSSGLRGGIKFNRVTTGGAFPHHIILTNLKIFNLNSTAVGGSANYSQLVNSQIYDNGGKYKSWTNKPEAYGTYLKGKNWLIKGNTLHSNTGNGIRTGNDPSTSTSELLVDSVIENNLIYNNGGTFSHPYGSYSSPDFTCKLVTGGDGIVVWHGSGNIIRNNVSSGNIGYGIRVNEDTTLSTRSNLVYNNTVYKNGNIGIYSYLGNKTLVRNNISYLNSKGNIFSGIASYNLTTDPKFINASARDFRLQSSSPAIDKGIKLLEVLKDFRGVARPRGIAYDIGAFEY